MTSDKQIEANRINALNSTGPQTPEGKARSCRNAFKHGLSSKHFVIDGEDYLYIDQTLDDLIEHYQPQSQDEYLLLERIVHGMINRQRGEHIMQQYYFVAERGGPLRYIDYIPGIQRYIRDSDRTVEKAYEILFRIRAERRKENKPVIVTKPENGFVSQPEFFKERKITSRPIPPLKPQKLG